MELLNQINNTSVYRNPAPQSPLQGANVMQPPVVYSKIMLRTIELAESDYVFDGLAVERTMPSNNGSNEIMFKRMLSLAAHTQPLAEGIPPASDQGRMVAIKASTKSYGRVMKFTDKVNWAVVDPLISEYTRQLALKVPETKDILAQQALLAEAQSFYACKKSKSESDPDILAPMADGTVTHIKRLTPDCAPTIDEFRKIVLSMEAAKVRPYQGANFLVLASSAVIFDLITDKRVKEFMKYTNTASSYSNDMAIDLFSLAFKKAKTIKTDNTYINGDGVLTYIYHAPAASNDGYTGAINILTTKPITELSGSDKVTIVYLDDKSKADAEITKTALNTATGSAYDVLNVHYSYVLGEECLFRIGVEGHTSPEFINKPLGSAGTEDPLNQRQSIGWKIDSLGYKVPNPDAVVAYMSCPTQYKININARPDLRNQFTDYYYGYESTDGRYWHPEQVLQTVVDGQVKYFVRGTNIEVTAIKMSKLVKPINGGRIGSDGKKPLVTGTVPTTTFALKSKPEIRFEADKVVKSGDKYYINGLVGTAAAEVVKLPYIYSDSVIKADGTGYETRSVVAEGEDVNKTGDPLVDGE
jgi:hypothetical protein